MDKFRQINILFRTRAIVNDLLFSVFLNLTIAVLVTYLIEEVMEVQIYGYGGIIWFFIYGLLLLQAILSFIVLAIGERTFKPAKLSKKIRAYIFTNILFIFAIWIFSLLLTTGPELLYLFFEIPFFIAWILLYKKAQHRVYAKRISEIKSSLHPDTNE